MQQARPAAATPLGLVIPRPVAPTRRSSGLRPGLASPRTPLSCATPPSSFFFNASTSSRRSRDSGSSWNSSNGDDADAPEVEWTADHVLRLQRTLDALPSHVLTPFTGPVPPSNLLDKIAKALAEHADWPHSLRATRAKIVELANSHGTESSVDGEANDRDSVNTGVLKPTTNTGPKRALYRQSSMDFIQTDKHDLGSSERIARYALSSYTLTVRSQVLPSLSRRLQKTDRMIANPAYHPYSRPSTPSSQSSVSENAPSLLPSALPQRGSRPEPLRRAYSGAYQPPDLNESPAPNSRVSRLRRSESFVSHAASPRPFKRAPSFSSSSDTSRMSVVESVKGNNAPSSDEEEKARSKQAKKPRTKAGSPTPVRISVALSNYSSRSSDTKKDDSDYSSNSLSSSSTKVSVSGTQAASPTSPNIPGSTATKRPRQNVQRNPSILGGLLPGIVEQEPVSKTGSRGSLPGSTVPRTTKLIPPRTLRRVKRTDLRSGILPSLSRKISFGSLTAPRDDDDGNYPSTGSLESTGSGSGLGEPFELH
ncbi:hypothetical protein NEOLEDRAFT_1181269 [Neolentinus lepideus HHB14362 ss-1]|uniref:Uncharacterized protein n=1 Tax=Neolentinus lepideus HHB14362 ss-1 TaxID=1314782 RepID=A0A165Q898_9AGAM|nr:hypothetical protein NEOLEDRAFT_1181269 [Neolentinus lepideus HHB14362 ss-1]